MAKNLSPIYKFCGECGRKIIKGKEETYRIGYGEKKKIVCEECRGGDCKRD